MQHILARLLVNVDSVVAMSVRLGCVKEINGPNTDETTHAPTLQLFTNNNFIAHRAEWVAFLIG